MAFGLGLLGTLALGRYGLDQYDARREQQRNEILQQGIQSALGQAPSLDASQFGSGQLESMDPGSGLLADPNSIESQLQFAGNIFDLPGGQAFASDIFRDALGYGQAQVAQDADINAAYLRQQRQLAQQQGQFDEQMRNDNFWKGLNLAQDQYEFQQGQAADLAEPQTGFEWSYDEGGNRLEVPKRYTDTWNKYYGAQTGFEDSITTLDELMTTFDEAGTEQLPTAAKGKLASLAATMQLKAKTFLDTGALSQDELTLINKLIRDPTELKLSGQSNAEIRAGYETAMDLLQRGLRYNNQLTKHWIGLGSNLDQQTPSQKRRAQALARAQQQAADIGLFDQPPGAPAPLGAGGGPSRAAISGRGGGQALLQFNPGGGGPAARRF